MSRIDEIEKRPEFVAYNQAVEDAKAAIRSEKVDDPYAAPTFINAIARKCSPHVYVNRLAGGERCAECGHERRCSDNEAGVCEHPGKRGEHSSVVCGCKCIFPASPEGNKEQLQHCPMCGHERSLLRNGQCHFKKEEIRPNVFTLCSCRCIYPAIEHPEDRCQKCGGPNIVWFAPSVIWNKAIRERDEPEILCPVCFVRIAEAAGFGGVWKVAPEAITPVPAEAAAQDEYDAKAFDESQPTVEQVQPGREREIRAALQSGSLVCYGPKRRVEITFNTYEDADRLYRTLYDIRNAIEQKCVWSIISEWIQTSCGEWSLTPDDFDAENHGMKFCSFCGKALVFNSQSKETHG